MPIVFYSFIQFRYHTFIQILNFTINKNMREGFVNVSLVLISKLTTGYTCHPSIGFANIIVVVMTTGVSTTLWRNGSFFHASNFAIFPIAIPSSIKSIITSPHIATAPILLELFTIACLTPHNSTFPNLFRTIIGCSAHNSECSDVVGYQKTQNPTWLYASRP